MDGNNDIENKLSSTKRANRRQKRTIIGLSVALLLSGATAITVPLVLNSIKGNNPSANTHTVTFDTNQGNPIEPVKVVDGEKCVQPQASRPGFTIREWTLNGQTFNFDTPIKSDITLIAQWDEEQKAVYHTVEFDANGGTTDAQTIQVVHGGHMNMPSAYKDGCSLDGWYSGDKKYTSSDPITSNLKLVAKWIDVPVVKYETIVFNAGDNAVFKSTGEKIATATIQAGKTFGSVDAPERIINDGYASQGWYLDSKFQTPITDTTVITGTTTVYAKYLRLTTDVTVTFSCNSANNEVLHGNANLTFEKGKTWADIKASAPNVTRDYYQFDGWYVDGAAIQDTYKFDDNTTLTAHMTPLQHLYTFNFKLSEDQVLTDGSETVKYDVGTAGTLWSAIPKPQITEGTKIFEGWYSDKGLTEAIPNDKLFTTTESNSIDVYAKFVEPQVYPTITFADPTTSNDTYTWVGNTVIKLDKASISFADVPQPGVYKDVTGGSWSEGYKSNYYFHEWYTLDSEGKEAAVPSIIDKSITIYPKFKSKPTLTFNNRAGSTIKTQIINPGDKWESIGKPDADIAKTLQSTERLQGWIGKFKNESDKRVIKPTDSLQKLDTDIALVPSVLENFHDLVFEEKGIINPVEETSQEIDITYEGTKTVGIEKAETRVIDINKPIPSASGHKLISWQYSLNNKTSWTIADSTSKIPATLPTEAGGKVYLRPVMETDVTITYNAGNHGQIKHQEQKDPIITNSSTQFSKLFKPDITPNDGFVFSHWEMNLGTEEVPNWKKVESDTLFSASTTLVARYKTDKVTSIVHFELTPADEKAKDSKIYGKSYAIVHEDTETKTFADVVQPYATKKYYVFDKWVLRTGSGTKTDPFKYETEVLPTTEIPKTEDGLTVYATFKQTTTYQKISIAEPTAGEYEILSDPNEQYVPTNTLFPLTSLDLKVKKVGYTVDDANWTYVDKQGKTQKITSSTKVTDDMVIKPAFKECKWQIKFSKDIYPTCTMSEDVIEINNYDTLYDKIKTRTASLDRYDFIEWKIKTDTGSYESIDQNTVVTGPLTIVPTFKGESEFKQGTQPYFYDEEKAKWAAIVDSQGANLTVKYAGSSTTTAYDKSKFNYEVFFGSQMTSIPDYFLQGCINFNNGSDGITEKPLTMPNNLTSIGKCVLHGCASFNQTLDFTNAASTLSIKEDFMRECYSFNKDLSFKTTKNSANIRIECGFMFDCLSFSKTLDLSGREFKIITKDTPSGQPELVDHTYYYHTLSTTDKLSSMYTKGFTVIVDSASKTTFNKLFPALDGSAATAYRKITIQ